MIANFASKKMWVSIITILAIIFGFEADTDQISEYIAGGIGGIYIIFQSIVDAIKESNSKTDN